MSNEDTIKENDILKTKISLLTQRNKKLEQNIRDLQDTFGFEICKYFEKCNSIEKTTKYFYFENVFDCYQALVEYFGCSDPLQNANDYKDCYQIIFGHNNNEDNEDSDDTDDD